MKSRKIKTKIWRDEWYLGLSRASKLLFTFLITNEYMGLSGYAEIPDSLICFHTGLTTSELGDCKKEIADKVRFFKGWVYVVNLLEHDPIEGGESNNIYKAYLKELDCIPSKIRSQMEALGKGLVSPSEGVKVMVKERERDRESVREKEKTISIFLKFFNEKSGKGYEETTGRSEKLEARLKKYSMEQILRATDSLLKSPYHTGQNEHKTWYATPDFLLRNDEMVDRWLNSQPTKKVDRIPDFIKNLPVTK